MRFKTVLSCSALAAFLATSVVGCSQSDEVRLAPAPPLPAVKSSPLPKDAKKGGGPASSGNMNRDPGAST
jgi:hypothetical protein